MILRFILLQHEGSSTGVAYERAKFEVHARNKTGRQRPCLQDPGSWTGLGVRSRYDVVSVFEAGMTCESHFLLKNLLVEGSQVSSRWLAP